MEKVKKVIFTFTGECRIPNISEWFRSGDTFLNSLNGSWTPHDIYTREEIEEVWKPKDGEHYFVIAFPMNIHACGIHESYWGEDGWDKNRFEIGNIFRTREAAEKKLEQIKEILKQ